MIIYGELCGVNGGYNYMCIYIYNCGVCMYVCMHACIYIYIIIITIIIIIIIIIIISYYYYIHWVKLNQPTIYIYPSI
jgi:hypothetical protein